MLRLGQVINPNAVSVLNKLGSVTMDVPERVAFRKFVNYAQPALKEWQELISTFKDKIAEKDSTTLRDLDAQWAKEVEVERLPLSLLDKLPQISPNEETALLEICENKQQVA